MLTVVYAAAKHELQIQLNSRVCELRKVFQTVARKTVAQHPASQLRFDRVNADIDGRNAHLYHTVDIPLLQVRQRDVIALQKRQPLVIVLEINALAHSLRVLVDEAENTLVRTALLSVHQIRFEFQPDVVVFRLVYRERHFASAAHNAQHNDSFGNIEAVVKHIVHGTAVYCIKFIARKYTGALSGGAFINVRDRNHKTLSNKNKKRHTFSARRFRIHQSADLTSRICSPP